MSQQYTITVSEAELAVVALALGRMLNPRKSTARKASAATATKATAPRAYRPKPPRLSDAAFSAVTSRWGEAVANPERWRAELANNAARNTNRQDHDLARAWGIGTDSARSAA